MDRKEIDILKKALLREKSARQQAEKILEEKSKELYLLSQELQKANNKLRGDLSETSSELKGVFGNLVDAYVLMDIKGNIIKMNDAAIDLLGYQPTEENLNVIKLVYKEDYNYAMQSFRKLIKEGTFSDYQARVYTKYKGVRNVHINASLINDRTGKPLAAQGIIRDITQDIKNKEERLELIQNLEQKNRDLNDFAHIVSHDLKSPLRAMDTLINWIKEDYSDKLDDKAGETFEILLNKVQKMDDLIDGILNYSSIDRINKGTESVDIHKLITDILNILHIPENTEISIDTTLPIIKGDTPRLQQLFQNLIGNAIKSIDKKEGKISIGSKEKKGVWEFHISDNGKGISKAYHNKIFEIFESIEDHDENTGIGLSIVKKIVTFYKGTIWLESKIGKGTTFYFTLKSF